MLEILKWAFGYALTIAIAIPLNGLLISLAWGWFIAPITGARAITISEGVGLSIFLSIAGAAATAHLIKYDFGDVTDGRRIAAKTLGKLIGIAILAPLGGLAIAWAWHAIMLADPNSN